MFDLVALTPLVTDKIGHVTPLDPQLRPFILQGLSLADLTPTVAATAFAKHPYIGQLASLIISYFHILTSDNYSYLYIYFGVSSGLI